MEHIRGIRERIGQGGSVFGTFLAELRASGAVSAMASGGLDFFMVDMEHGNYDVSEARRLIDVGKQMQICPLVRVPLTLEGLYAQVLDAGAEGVLTPQVRTMDDVRRAVNLTKYPPMGRRGIHFVRPHDNFIPPDDRGKYIRQTNEQLATFIQIETVEAAELADEIAATEGVDGLYIGPSDMGVSLAQAGIDRDEGLAKTTADVGAACRRHGKIAGYHFEGAERLPALLEHGFRLFGYSCALQLLMNGLAELMTQMETLGVNN